MEIAFDQLLACSIKRVTRPKFKHDFPTLYDAQAFSNDYTELDDKTKVDFEYDPTMELMQQDRDALFQEVGANRNDISTDGVSQDCAMDYVGRFGKVYTGEQFRTTVTLMNAASGYTLNQVKVTFMNTREPKVDSGKSYNQSPEKLKARQEILKEEVIPVMQAKEQKGFHFSFKILEAEIYHLIIQVEYTSHYFTEQLNQYLQKSNADDLTDFRNIKGSKEHSIDINKRVVKKFFLKKYKFEVEDPVAVTKKVEFIDNSFMAQCLIHNVSNQKMFIDRVQFNNAHIDALQLYDHSKKPQNGHSLFKNSVSFQPDEQRSYLFQLRPKDPSLKLTSYVAHNLGNVEFHWTNYMGDTGQLDLGTFISPRKNPHQNYSNKQVVQQQLLNKTADPERLYEIELVDKHLKLVLEKPEWVTFKLHNNTDKPMRINLQVAEVQPEKDPSKGECQIVGFDPQLLSKILPGGFVLFKLQLFPKACGVCSVRGLRITCDGIRMKPLESDLAEFTVYYN